MITFEDARQVVAADWPDYDPAPWGFEGDEDWFVLLLPETTGGRIAAVDKESGELNWINENADEYTQERPAGAPHDRNAEESTPLAITYLRPGARTYKRDERGRFGSGGGGGEHLTGQDALDAVPATYRSGPEAHFGNYEGAEFDAPPGHGDSQALAEYEGVEFQVTNTYLRHGPTDLSELSDENYSGADYSPRSLVAERDAATAHRVAEIDKTMDVSPLKAPVEVSRVIQRGGSVFGNAWHEGVINKATKDFDEQDKEYDRWQAGERPNLTGLSWHEKGYVSTSAAPGHSEAFGARWANWHKEGHSGSDGEPVIMNIRVPKGVKAVRLGDLGWSTGPGGRKIMNSGEIMLQHGLTMKVTADHGIDEQGFRRLDIEATPS